MGYYTTYTLDIYDTELHKVDGDQLINLMAELVTHNDYIDYILDTDGEPTYNETKWYSHDQEMLELSAEFPDYLFYLIGVGEDSGDVWSTVYHTGHRRAEWQLDATIPTIKELLQSE